MPPKKSRYATSLAADWVVPNPVAVSVAEVDREDTPKSPYILPQPSPMAKPTRYKKILPQAWMDSNKVMGDGDPTDLRPRADQESIDFEPPGKLHDRPKTHLVQTAHFIDTSIPKQANSGYTPPGAPKSSRFPPGSMGQAERSFDQFSEDLSHSPRHGAREVISAGRYRTSSETEQRHSQDHIGTRGQYYDQDATLSPPISVGQLSSAPTTSPYHGRDLPVKCPAMSPAYSVI